MRSFIRTISTTWKHGSPKLPERKTSTKYSVHFFCTLSKTLPLTGEINHALEENGLLYILKKDLHTRQGSNKAVSVWRQQEGNIPHIFQRAHSILHATVTSGSWFVQEIYHVAISHGTKLVDFLFNRLSCRADIRGSYDTHLCNVPWNK